MEPEESKFVSVRKDLLEKGLKSVMTGEEMRVFVSYFIAGGNEKVMSELGRYGIQKSRSADME